jgi:hypothetical protein
MNARFSVWFSILSARENSSNEQPNTSRPRGLSAANAASHALAQRFEVNSDVWQLGHSSMRLPPQRSAAKFACTARSSLAEKRRTVLRTEPAEV